MSPTPLSLALALLAAAGCSAPHGNLDPVFGTDSSIAIVATPGDVAGYRLDPEHDGAQPVEATPGGYPILEGPLEVEGAVATELRALLTDPATFPAPEAAKGCLPRYGVRLEFVQPEGRVDVVVCLECSVLLVYRDDVHAGTGHFDDASEDLEVLLSRARLLDD